MTALHRAPHLPTKSAGPEDLVRACDAAYLAVWQRLLAGRLGSDEATACCVQHLAEFCQFFHTGRFADGRLENPLLEIAGRLANRMEHSRLCPGLDELAKPRTRRHVLHVATSVQDIGGHTRTIIRWAENDADTRHSLVVIRQDGIEIPAGLSEAIRASGGAVVEFPRSASVLLRAWWLRQAGRHADIVMLHHFGCDVAPVIAFGVAGGPPVALVNHADHIFWLGSSVADAIVQQRGISRVLGPERRHYQRDALLPIPLAEPTERLSRAEARSRLGVHDSQIALVSVGRATKYVPTATHHFVRMAASLLDRCPAAHLYLVGVAEDDRRVWGEVERHPRLHLCGAVPDASMIMRAADVYLEGFPFGSQTALLEAALEGVPAVRAFAPPLDLLAGSDESIDELLPTPASEQEYVEQAASLVGDEARRAALGTELRRRVLGDHVGDGWREHLHGVYRQLTGMTHEPRTLPVTECSLSARDQALSAWQVRQHASPEAVWREANRVPLSAAYLAREGGDYRGALSVLWRWARSAGPGRAEVAAALKLLPHWLMRTLRRDPRKV